jgi:hypothetical protein
MRRDFFSTIGRFALGSALLASGLLSAGTAQSGVVRSATGASVVVGTTQGTCCDIGNAIDQSGLDVGYTSGVTDFDAYIGSNPLHTMLFRDTEYFSRFNTTTGVVEFDLGAVMDIDRIALWNEESAGISQLDILVSADGIGFTEVVSDFVPLDNPADTEYPAEVIGLGGTFNIQYLRIDMNACPNPWCSIGEVAFSMVPEPTTLALLGLGLAGIGLSRRRRR